MATQLHFLRPRRFGKSLLLSMVAHNDEENMSGDFQQLFGDSVIDVIPTSLNNQYCVLRRDFSQMHSDPGNLEELRQRLNPQVTRNE